MSQDNIRHLLLYLAVVATILIAGQVEAAQKTYGDLTVSKVVHVYDGDTFRVNIEGLPPIIGNNIAIRINGYDTPEIRGKCPKEKALAIVARDRLRGMVKDADIVLLNTKRGKYFRIVADVMIDGKNIKDTLIEEGLAVSYDGGRKASPWCK